MKSFSFEEIAKAKEIANRNFDESALITDEDMTGFWFNGMKIINPWIDEFGDKEFTDEQAIKHYGLENVLNFIINILKEGK